MDLIHFIGGQEILTEVIRENIGKHSEPEKSSLLDSLPSVTGTESPGSCNIRARNTDFFWLIPIFKTSIWNTIIGIIFALN